MADLRAAGYDKNAVRRMMRAGTLTRLCRGAYSDREPDDARARHRLVVRAVLSELSDSAVASHVSAAVLRRRHHRRGPAAGDTPRQAAGVGRAGRGGCDETRARRRAAEGDRLARRAGCPARRRLRGARSESIGESRSRVAIALAGLPPPQLQWPVRLGGSTAYTDFAWPERRTVGEFDGKVKYGRLLRPGQSPGDVVYAEKLREDAIRAQGLEVVRWTWADLGDFADTAARIQDRLRA